MMMNMLLSDSVDKRYVSSYPNDVELSKNPSALFRAMGEASSMVLKSEEDGEMCKCVVCNDTVVSRLADL